MKRGQILKEALSVINGERQDQYGAPENSFTTIAEYWTTYLSDLLGGNELGPIEVAHMMALFKIAREQHQYKRDNLVDAAGYLGIAGDMYDDPDIENTHSETSLE